MRRHLILCFLSISHLVCSQPSLPEFGINTGEEVSLKECPFDKNAGAVVIFDYAVSDHDDDYRLITHRRVKIKILNQREIEQGNIRIPFYSGDKFEYIDNLRGITSNYEGGQFQTAMLDKKTVFIEKEDNNWSNMRFAMPSVKAGSIIEYEYDSYKKHYGGLFPWKFQTEIPTMKSALMLTLLPGSEFQYSLQRKANYPITVKPFPEQGRVYFEMNNIPGLKFEPFMDAVRDYLQRVEFQLASYTFRGNKTRVNQSWGDVANDLVSDKSFGGVIKKDLSNTNDIKAIVANQSTDSGRLAAIYNYVRKNFTCTQDYGKYASDGLKTAWERRVGTAAEINLILLNLLQQFNIESSPLLVAERDFGKIDSTYPFLDRFNKVVAYAKASGRSYIMDATQKYCPPDLTPYPLLNTIGFVVDRKEHRLIRILGRGFSYENNIEVNAKVDSKGMLEGAADISSWGYAKQLRTEKIKKDAKKFVIDILQEAGSDLVVDACNYENLDDESQALVQKVKFHNELNLSGGFAFINYNMFTGFAKNPFTASERFTNVNFGFPYKIALTINLELPEKAKLDKLPAEKTTTSSDRAIFVSRVLKKDGNRVTINIAFRQTTTLIGYNQYNDLKWVYSQINDLLNEAIVVKLTE